MAPLREATLLRLPVDSPETPNSYKPNGDGLQPTSDPVTPVKHPDDC